MSVYSFVLKIDSTDVATYGVTVSEIPTNWDAPAITIAEVQIPGWRGTRRTTANRQYAPMDYTVKGNLIGTSPSDFEAKRDSLAVATLGNTVTLIGGNQTARQRTGVVSAIKYPLLYPSADEAEIEIDVHCEDPLTYATTASTVTGVSAADLSCSLGTEASWPVVTVDNPASPLVLTYKDHAGATVQTATITFPGSPASIVVDMLNQTIVVAGTRHDEYLSAGNYFALSPLDAVYGAAWPTVRASSGSGSPAVSIAYTPAFR